MITQVESNVLELFEWWSMHPLLGEKLARGKPSSVIGRLQWNRIETLLDYKAYACKVSRRLGFVIIVHQNPENNCLGDIELTLATHVKYY